MNNEIKSLIESAPNETIMKSMLKTYSFLNNKGYFKIMVSVSGGADSDIVIDLCKKFDLKNVCDYVWFNTGLEYEATKRHLNYLEKRYGIKIKKRKPDKNIIQATREFGQPFVSKYASDMIYRLQEHGFEWDAGKALDVFLRKYSNCKSALRWWTGEWEYEGESRFNVNRNKYLKEFIIENVPWFKISNKCCDYAKKNVSKKYREENGIWITINGVRKAEGGVRSTAYKNCFVERESESLFMPIFWYKNKDKEMYEKAYGIIHSDCYTKYGFVRTGCAACPFAGIKNVNNELKAISKYEPKLYKICWNVFGDSYLYMRMYKDFKDNMDGKNLDKLRKDSPNYGRRNNGQ